MKIDKAIKILEAYQGGVKLSRVKVLEDALQLGIEALKTIKAERTIYGFKRQVRLPGED